MSFCGDIDFSISVSSVSLVSAKIRMSEVVLPCGSVSVSGELPRGTQPDTAAIIRAVTAANTLLRIFMFLSLFCGNSKQL